MYKKISKHIKIAFHAYYELNYDYNDLSKLRFIELLKLAKQKSIIFTKYHFNKHSHYDAILLIDIPKPIDLIKIIFKNRFQNHKKLILILEETPIARQRFLLKIPFLFDAVMINTVEEKLENPFYPIFCYKHSSLDTKEKIIREKEKILNPNRPKKLCYIGKNNTAFSKLTTYDAKQRIIASLNNYPNQFSLYGYGWDRISIPIDFPLRPIIARLKILQKIIKYCIYLLRKLKTYRKIYSLGIAPSKLEVYSQHEFCLAFEPYIGRPYVILEKIFDPMKAGCIPLYLGNNKVQEILGAEIFIKINKDDDAKKILNLINKLSEQEKQSYRERIFNFLQSDKANQFRCRNASNNFLEDLLSIIKNK